MLTREILDYIRQQLGNGVSKEEVQKNLASVGWSEQDIADALSTESIAPEPAPIAPQVPVAQQNPAVNTPVQTVGKLPSVGRLLSESWALYRERFGVLFWLYAIPSILFFAGLFMLSGGGLEEAGIICCSLGLLLFLPSGIGIIFSLDKGSNIGESISKGFALFFPALWLCILMAFIIGGGYMLLIVPGIIMSVQFSLGLFVVALEESRGLGALIQSREYVRGYWWAVVGRALVVSIGIWIISIGIGIATAFAAVALGKTAADAEQLRIIAQAIPAIFIGPFAVAYSYKLYQYLRALKPTLAANPATGRRGFLIFCAVLGPVGFIVLMVLFVGAFLWIFATIGNLHINSSQMATSTAFTASSTTPRNQTIGAQPTTTPARNAPPTSSTTVSTASTGSTTPSGRETDSAPDGGIPWSSDLPS